MPDVLQCATDSRTVRGGILLRVGLKNPTYHSTNDPFDNLGTIHMEVHLKPETESRLRDLAVTTGRPTDELMEDAMAGYLAEVGEVRAMIDERYDDIKHGRVVAAALRRQRRQIQCGSLWCHRTTIISARGAS
jgi:predicted transcriptional regulator